MNLRKLIRNGINGINAKKLTKFKYNKDLNKAIKSANGISGQQHDYFQQNILNFYNPNTVTPFMPVSAKGPWIITSNGAIVYDVGGYGMLGFGHSPEWCSYVLGKDHVMANVMTPNKYQYKLTKLLREIGQSNNKDCPYSHFCFLNSGSESIELSKRIIDLGYKNDEKVATIVLKNGFHGRTTNAARLSDSTRTTYEKLLGSKMFSNQKIVSVEVNNLPDFNYTFNDLAKDYKIDAVYMEPVMGEGNPGIKLDRNFYQLVREKTKQNNTKLVIDSVQSCLRTTGNLSIVDYSWLKGLDAPDMEIFSKAITNGHYPLSILALRRLMKDQYKTGIYGNTYTGNPKALDLCYHTLKNVDDKVKENIVIMGTVFKNMLYSLQEKHKDIVTNVTGTGLLLALHIREDIIVDEQYGLEYICRKNGLNVIHGGKNALRFTPYFLITKDEIELIKSILDQSLMEVKLKSI